MKPIVTVEGRVIRATRVEPDVIASWGIRSAYEISLDGEPRGYLSFPTGWGGEWTLWSLRRPDLWLGYQKAHGWQVVRRGGYRRRTGNATYLDAPGLMRLVPAFVAEGRMPTADEADREAKEKIAQRKADERRRAEETAEGQRKRKADEVAREARRRETLEGLVSIRDRLGSRMTNFEASALAEAIDTTERSR